MLLGSSGSQKVSCGFAAGPSRRLGLVISPGGEDRDKVGNRQNPGHGAADRIQRGVNTCIVIKPGRCQECKTGLAF